MPFSDFLAALFRSFAEEGVRACVLRNYESFPASNAGNDIDLLILPSELPRAIRALRSIQQLRIVGYSEGPFVANLFLAGVCPSPGVRALQIDFDLGLTWKGLPYLSTETVLDAARPRRAGSLEFFVPSPVHEAIISLFASLLVGVWLKERYFPGVRRTFARDRTEAIAALLPQFGAKAATAVVDAVIDGGRGGILDCVGPLRAALLRRGLLRRPASGALAMARHHVRVFAFRHSPQQLVTVGVLGCGGHSETQLGEKQLIEALLPMLRASARVVERRTMPERLPGAGPRSGTGANADSRAGSPGGSFVSIAKLVLRILEAWWSRFAEKKGFTLRIFEGDSANLPAAHRGRREGVPLWLARLAGRLLPSPDLWLLLDADTDRGESENGDALPAEALGRLEAGLAFAKTGKRRVLLDARKPAASVAEQAYAAIIDVLAERADRQLKRCFYAFDAAAGKQSRRGDRA